MRGSCPRLERHLPGGWGAGGERAEAGVGLLPGGRLAGEMGRSRGVDGTEAGGPSGVFSASEGSLWSPDTVPVVPHWFGATHGALSHSPSRYVRAPSWPQGLV